MFLSCEEETPPLTMLPTVTVEAGSGPSDLPSAPSFPCTASYVPIAWAPFPSLIETAIKDFPGTKSTLQSEVLGRKASFDAESNDTL